LGATRHPLKKNFDFFYPQAPSSRLTHFHFIIEGLVRAQIHAPSTQHGRFFLAKISLLSLKMSQSKTFQGAIFPNKINYKAEFWFQF